jgi:hypothetical protein
MGLPEDGRCPDLRWNLRRDAAATGLHHRAVERQAAGAVPLRQAIELVPIQAS